MTEKARYLFGQKLSNYQIERILHAYAEGVTATEVVRTAAGKRGARATNTVHKLYELVRKRLLEIGYYPDADRYFAYWRDESDGKPPLVFSEAFQRIRDQSVRFRGATERTAEYLWAEVIFRAENPTITPGALFRDIKLAVKVTGPLNLPPVNLDMWHERLQLARVQQGLSLVRRHQPRTKTPRAELFAPFEKAIAETNRSIRRKRRARAKVEKDHALGDDPELPVKRPRRRTRRAGA